MVRKVIKRVGGKRYIINIPVVGIDDGFSLDIENTGGPQPTASFQNILFVISFTTTEDNNIRITEDGNSLFVIE